MNEDRPTMSSALTPLQLARQRFVEGLPKKATELEGALASLKTAPNDGRSVVELRRRLHALFASAQVFQYSELADTLRRNLDGLDRAKSAGGEVSSVEPSVLIELETLIGRLPSFIHGSNAADSPKTELPKTEQQALVAQGDGRSDETAPPNVAGFFKVPLDAGEPQASAVHGDNLATSRANTEGAARISDGPAIPKPPSFRLPLPTSARKKEPPAMERKRRASLRDIDPSVFVRRSATLDTLLTILVVDSEVAVAEARALLSSERFEVIGTEDPLEALRIARAAAPDVVFASISKVSAVPNWIHELRTDRMSDSVPIVLIHEPSETVEPAMRMSVTAVISRPFDGDQLVRLIAQVAGVMDAGLGQGLRGEVTLEELVKRLSEQLKMALQDSVIDGGNAPIPLGDGAEVVAALWSAITRIRSVVAQKTGGALRFHDKSSNDRTAHLALVEETLGALSPDDVSRVLHGRMVMVVDDDPAIVWFFGGLLRQAGAFVVEASDGQEALALARKHRPDVVISDILMPIVDGYLLSRMLRRDPVLSNVPVLLLSWKEDLLQRMQELRSEATGYLTKEASAPRILEAVARALLPLSDFQSKLLAGGDVQGRVETVGIWSLLTAVADSRPNAHLSIRTARNFFDLEFESGRLADIMRTASDGSFVRGERALLPLLGTSAGRFVVAEARGFARETIQGGLKENLGRISEQLRALVDRVSGKSLMQIDGLGFDTEVVESIERASPDVIRNVLLELRKGTRPRALLLDGAIAPDELESILVDLARQGAIVTVSLPPTEESQRKRERELQAPDVPFDDVLMESIHPPAMPSGVLNPHNAATIPPSSLHQQMTQDQTVEVPTTDALVRETMRAPRESLETPTPLIPLPRELLVTDPNAQRLSRQSASDSKHKAVTGQTLPLGVPQLEMSALESLPPQSERTAIPGFVEKGAGEKGGGEGGAAQATLPVPPPAVSALSVKVGPSQLAGAQVAGAALAKGSASSVSSIDPTSTFDSGAWPRPPGAKPLGLQVPEATIPPPSSTVSPKTALALGLLFFALGVGIVAFLSRERLATMIRDIERPAVSVTRPEISPASEVPVPVAPTPTENVWYSAFETRTSPTPRLSWRATTVIELLEIDGQRLEVGVGHVDVSPGIHEIRVEVEGRVPQVRFVHVGANQERVFVMPFEDSQRS